MAALCALLPVLTLLNPSMGTRIKALAKSRQYFPIADARTAHIAAVAGLRDSHR
jgi:hypothetical protein